MANTVATQGQFTSISDIDSDFVYTSISSSRIRLASIKFIPGAAGDSVVIKETTDAGPIITKLQSLDGEARVDQSFQLNTKASPMLDFSESVVSAGSVVIIQRR